LAIFPLLKNPSFLFSGIPVSFPSLRTYTLSPSSAKWSDPPCLIDCFLTPGLCSIPKTVIFRFLQNFFFPFQRQPFSTFPRFFLSVLVAFFPFYLAFLK